ncbi:MAG: hypothetical protein EZS28_006654 [Streblomastix strix]|uniref:Uncharacterized protein n=1 Tax=Streblomastix strix TaxID=222440 RepID=A0A5J4WSC6_9EUKA|nr:MAG: hypothetical protein EZS28_006654 [Streblomastix strix]
MGFFSGIANFGSKILGGVKKAAQWVAPALHKVLSTISGPVGMIHPGIGGALGAGANIAGAVDRLKRGNSSGGMMSNEEYQLFIDNNNALVYAANNQIVDGMASDYALKIETTGLLTIKNLKVINFDFVAQINQLFNQVNLLQQSIGTTEQDITDIKNDIDIINQELSRQTHFRGYYLLNTDNQNLPDSANGDFSFSAESGTVWMYDQNWYNSGDIVPDQVTPASDATPLSDGTATAGISTDYSRGDHVHPLNVTTTIPPSDSASGSVGTTNYYARNDHSHPLNITTSIPAQDNASGSVGTTNYYARNDHSHPINVETNASNIPIVNGVGANGSSSFYARQDHVHLQQLTYDGNVTATKFIKTGGLTTEVLCSNGDTNAISDIVSNYVDLTTYQTITGEKTFDTIKKTNGINQQILLADGSTKSIVYANWYRYISTPEQYVKLSFADGLRIARCEDSNGGCSIILGCNKTQTTGMVDHQWQIYSPASSNIFPFGLVISLSSDYNNVNRELHISADGYTLTFNGSVIAGTGATNGATNGSVNYSAGNPILWGVNSVGTEGGFYSDGAKVYWRAKPVTLGSVPP